MFRSTVPRSTATCVAVLLTFAFDAKAQQTIFNVPSADVLDRGKLYLETDQYLRFWGDGDDAAVYLVRGVYGVGYNVEVGVNTGTFDYLHRSAPFADAAIKWRPFQRKVGPEDSPGTVSLIVGDHVGYSLRGGVEPRWRNYAYVAGAYRAESTQTRIGAGAYHVTKHVFTDEHRVGAQLTAEQPITAVPGLTLAADWFSGDGGYFTPGLIQTAGRWTFYGGYGFADTGGRDADLLTLELGVVLF